MSDTDNPTKKSFVEQLDEAVQEVKRNSKIMPEYIQLQLPEKEISKILADDIPKNLEV